MNILNLTPHLVNILKKECTVKERFGKILLRQECSLEDSLITSVSPEPTPLTITPNDKFCLPYNTVPIYHPIYTAQDNYGFGAYWQNNIPGNCPFLFDCKCETADAIIVSLPCANYINAIVRSYQQGDIRILNLFDKFCIPYGLVYPNRTPNSASQGFTGRKPIGALGLQKVIACQHITFYAEAIRMGLTVSISALRQSALDYINQHPAQRCYEPALQAVNNYLLQQGYSPYPELYPRQY